MAVCIYHSNCADGFGAAWVVRKALGDIEFHPGKYHEPPPDVTGKDVVIVDFSYKRPVLLEMAEKADSILILDHHKTAAEERKCSDCHHGHARRARALRTGGGRLSGALRIARPPRCVGGFGAQLAHRLPKAVRVERVGRRAMDDSLTIGDAMREVKEHEFWAEIGKQNVHPRIEGKFPFTSVFVTPSGLERGRIIESLPRVNGAPQKRHMVPNAEVAGA